MVNKLNIEGEFVLTLPINIIDRIFWDEESGKRLESARESKKLSRQQLADGIKELTGEDCSQQLLYKIERSPAGWISLKLLLAYCQAAGIDISSHIPVYVNFFSQNVEKKFTNPLTVSTDCVNINL